MTAIINAHSPTEFLEALRPLFDCLTDGVCVADAGGKLLYANAAAAALLGPAAEKASDRPICSVLCGGLKGTAGETPASCPVKIPGGPASSATFRGPFGPSGRDLRVRCLRASLSHAEFHFLVIEDDSAAAEDGRQQEESRQMFVHDVRVPLTNAVGILRTLEDMGAGHTLTAREIELVRIGVRGCGRIGTLVDDYLQTARLEEGAMPIHAADVDVGRLIHDCADEQSEAAHAGGLILSVDARGAPTARADRELLHRALLNLISNALKFTPAGGKVSVGVSENDGAVVIRVADDGPGIPAADLAHVFERFYQGTNGHRHKGFGLGLTFCRAALHAMGGEVTAESEPGKGSVFTLRLPKCAAGEVGAS